MWKFVERACIVLGAVFAGGCFYVEWAPHTGWWLPKPPNVHAVVATATAPEPGVSMTTWALAAFLFLGIGLLITGSIMWFVRLQVARAEEKGKKALPPKQLSMAELQLNLAMRTFVLSKLQAVANAYWGVLHEIINRKEGGPSMSMLTGPQWRATRTFALDAASLLVSVPFDALRPLLDKPENEIDGDAAQKAIREILPQYETAKNRLRLMPTAAGIPFNVANLEALKDAELRAIDALRDMQASPAAKDLKQSNPEHLRPYA